ncbi:MAG TPA: hypothetical protein VFJ94_09270 [Intrasporangium sp.]|nr:hypothetical protein [Intrasporangium sp.]
MADRRPGRELAAKGERGEPVERLRRGCLVLGRGEPAGGQPRATAVTDEAGDGVAVEAVPGGVGRGEDAVPGDELEVHDPSASREAAARGEAGR